jgi:hippurate hydrolase
MKNLFVSLSIASVFAAPALAQSVPGLVQTYKGLHAHPELSHHEEHTSALLAGELRKAGYAVTERVGRYPDGTQAYGLVAILQNGAGPKLLIRADMDALPIVEETGLPYASAVKTKNPAGQDVGVMHACGHDIHVTTLIGVARVLAQSKSQWHGTVMLVGQPSEETIDGAKAMVDDHLYERFGKPDFAIALHDTNGRAAGTVSLTSGAAMAGSTSVDVVIRGIGGHGSQPQVTKDPIVMAGEFIVQLQTIVSRQENPRDPAVVTVGDIHGGTKRNIIPNEVKLELTTRAFTPQARQIIVDGIKHTARGVGVAAGLPDELMPVVTVLDGESTPVLYNDPALTLKIKSALAGALGAQNVFDEDPIMASEDFGALGLENHQIPTVLFWLGAMDPEKFAAAAQSGKMLPGLHTGKFAPVPETTLRTGVTAMSSAAIALLQ